MPFVTAFHASRVFAAGDPHEVALKRKELLDADPSAQILVFDDATGEQVDLDHRYFKPQAATPTRGRPRLGVVSREVTLLPKHWEWLAAQPGGASVALRKLVEHAAKATQTRDRIRHAQEAAHRFATAMAGNEPGFEEAMRSLFKSDKPGFAAQTKAWPPHVRDYAAKLAATAFVHEV